MRTPVGRTAIRLLAAVAAVAVASPAARAETRRLAVIIGHNVGSGARPPLRFAEEDALRVAAVLEELGGFRSDDLLVLRGPTLASVARAFGEAHRRVGRWRSGGDQVVALFYFSGHSDGQTLELASDRLAFADVRRWFERSGADVRIGIVDTCKSGALLAIKGGTLAPEFDLHRVESLTSRGEVLITSSAASEVALESSEIGASFFSHHLVSGLRGAADVSGDGSVTLAEAYQYAFGRTVSATAGTLVGPQHPGYDFRLSGRGDMVLTEIRRPSAAIDLPEDLDQIVVRRAGSLAVVAEVAATTARRIALLPGDYEVRGWRQGQAFAARVQLGTGQISSLRLRDMRPVSFVASSQKGGHAFEPSAGWLATATRRPRLFVGLGMTRALSRELDLLPTLRWRLGGRASTAAALALDLATGYHQDPGLGPRRSFRESRVQLLAGLRRSRQNGRLALSAGAYLGAGAANQRTDEGGSRWTALGTAAVTGTLRLRISGSSALALEGQAPITVGRVEWATRVFWLPLLWLGVEIDL